MDKERMDLIIINYLQWLEVNGPQPVGPIPESAKKIFSDVSEVFRFLIEESKKENPTEHAIQLGIAFGLFPEHNPVLNPRH